MTVVAPIGFVRTTRISPFDGMDAPTPAMVVFTSVVEVVMVPVVPLLRTSADIEFVEVTVRIVTVKVPEEVAFDAQRSMTQLPAYRVPPTV